jgi:hypothetical protein
MATFEKLAKLSQQQEEEETEEQKAQREFASDIQNPGFNYKDFMRIAPPVNSVDYYIAANYKPIDFATSNQRVASDPFGAFVSGLSLHNAGKKPDSYASLDGLSYLVGSLIPLLSINRLSASAATGMFGRLGFTDDAVKFVQTGSRGKGPMGSGSTLTGRFDKIPNRKTTGKVEPFKSRKNFENIDFKGPLARLGIDPTKGFGANVIINNPEKFDAGMRIAMEAGLWTNVDAELDGILGYRDALMYTALGEGFAELIGITAKRFRNPKRFEGADGNTGFKQITNEHGDIDVSKLGQEASDKIENLKGTVSKETAAKLTPEARERAKALFTELNTVVKEYKDVTKLKTNSGEAVLKELLEKTPEDFKNVIFKYENNVVVGIKDNALELTQVAIQNLTDLNEDLINQALQEAVTQQVDDVTDKATRQTLLQKTKTNIKAKVKRLRQQAETPEQIKALDDLEETPDDTLKALIEKRKAEVATESYIKENLADRIAKIDDPHFKGDTKKLGLTVEASKGKVTGKETFNKANQLEGIDMSDLSIEDRQVLDLVGGDRGGKIFVGELSDEELESLGRKIILEQGQGRVESQRAKYFVPQSKVTSNIGVKGSYVETMIQDIAQDFVNMPSGVREQSKKFSEVVGKLYLSDGTEVLSSGSTDIAELMSTFIKTIQKETPTIRKIQKMQFFSIPGSKGKNFLKQDKFYFVDPNNYFPKVEDITRYKNTDIPMSVYRAREDELAKSVLSILKAVSPRNGARLEYMSGFLNNQQIITLADRLLSAGQAIKTTTKRTKGKTDKDLIRDFLEKGGKIKKLEPAEPKLDVDTQEGLDLAFEKYLKKEQAEIADIIEKYSLKNIENYLIKTTKITKDKLGKGDIRDIRNKILLAEFQARTQTSRYYKLATGQLEEELMPTNLNQLEEVYNTLWQASNKNKSSEWSAKIAYYQNQMKFEDNIDLFNMKIDIKGLKEITKNPLLTSKFFGKVKLDKQQEKTLHVMEELVYNLFGNQIVDKQGVQYFANITNQLAKNSNFLPVTRISSGLDKSTVGFQIGSKKFTIQELTNEQYYANKLSRKYIILPEGKTPADYTNYLNNLVESSVKQATDADIKALAAKAQPTEQTKKVINVSGSTMGNRARMGKEIENIGYLKKQINRVLDSAMDAATWKSSTAAIQAKSFVISDTFIEELTKTIDTAIDKDVFGNIKPKYIRQMVEELVKERGILNSEIPTNIPMGPRARRALNDIETETAIVGAATRTGTDANYPEQILQMQKVLKSLGENLDNINSNYNTRLVASETRAMEVLQELSEIGIINTTDMPVAELRVIADFLNTNATLQSQSTIKHFVGDLYDYLDGVARETLQLQGEYGTLTPKFTYKKGQPIKKQQRKAYAEGKDKDIFTGEINPKTGKPIKSVSKYASRQNTLQAYDLSKVDKMLAHSEVFKDVNDMLNLLHHKQLDRTQGQHLNQMLFEYFRQNADLIDDFADPAMYRPDQSIVTDLKGQPVSPKVPNVAPVIGGRTANAFPLGGDLPSGLEFKKRLAAQTEQGLGPGDLGYDQVIKDFLLVMSDNPQLWNRWAASHMQTRKQIDKIYHLARAAYGDKKAGHILTDMIDNEHQFNKLHMANLNYTYNNPNKITREGTDVIRSGDISTGDKSVLDDAGKKSDNFKNDGDSDNPAGGDQGGSPGKADRFSINPIAKMLWHDPAKIFKKAYEQFRDVEFLDMIDKARQFVTNVARTGADYNDWYGQSLFKKRFDAYVNKRQLSGRDLIEFNQQLTDNVRVINSKLEIFRNTGSKRKIAKRRKDLEAQKGLTKEQIDADINAEIVAAKALDEAKLNSIFKDMKIEGDYEQLIRSYHTSMREIRDRVYNVHITKQLNDQRVAAGLEPLAEIDDIVGYYPLIADGNFTVSLQKKGTNQYINIGTMNKSNSKEVNFEVERFFEENKKILGGAKEDDFFVHVQPTGRDYSLLDDDIFVDKVNKTFTYNWGTVKSYFDGQQEIVGETLTDYLARAGKHRGITPVQITPYKDIDEVMAGYYYNLNKSAQSLPFIAQAKKLADKYGTRGMRGLHGDDLPNYIKEYTDTLMGRKGGLEKGTDKFVNGLMEYMYKVPVIKQGMDYLKIEKNGYQFRGLSNMIQSLTSFVALGANPAAALLQYTIVGLNVLPRIMINGSDARPLIKAWQNIGKIDGHPIYGEAFKRAGLEIFKQDGAVKDIWDNAGLSRIGSARQGFRTIKEYSLAAFQGADKQSRMFSLIAGYEDGRNILNNIVNKNSRTKLTPDNYRQYLTQDEQLMFLRMQAKRIPVGTKLGSATRKDLLSDYAVDFMEQTNHTYNSFNNPLAFSNPVAKPFLQFKTWVQKEIMFFADAFRDGPVKGTFKERWGNAVTMTGTFIGLGGIFSLPGAQELDIALRWATGSSPKAWFYEQDSPFMDVASGGFFPLAGLSMEGRTGPGNLFTVVDPDNIFGIFPSRLWKSAMAFRSGEVERAVNYALPRFVQNLKQGWNMATTGELRNNYNGGLMFDVDKMSGNPMMNMLYTMAGFQTMDAARYQTLKFALIDAGAARGRDRKWVYHSIFKHMDNNNVQEAKALADEAGIRWGDVSKLYRRRNEEDFKNLRVPYFKKDEIEERLGPVYNPEGG